MSNIGNNTTSPAPVPWNTVLFTLIPLATSVMTQPAGSVLGTAPISRTYLRSSPIFCAFDALAFLINIVIYRFLGNNSFKRAGLAAVRHRFKDIVYEGEGIQAFERTALSRWLFFLLGTTGAAFKLVTAEGLPWTKAWGLMFFASFIVFEGMIFLSKKETEYEIQLPLATQRPHWNLTDHVLKVAKWLSILGHSALLLFAILSLYSPDSSAGSDAGQKSLASPQDATGKNPAVISWASLPPLLWHTMTAGSVWLLTKYGKDPIFFVLLTPAAIFGVYLLVEELERSDNRQVTLGGAFVLAASASLVFLAMATQKIALLFQDLGERLLVTDVNSIELGGNVLRPWPLVFFVVNFVTALLWYSLRYNPEGTSNPGWTSIFS